MFTRLILYSTLVLLTACSGLDVDTYTDNTPELVPQQFLQGDLDAHGVVKNRSGEVIRYFNATIKAHWEDGTGTLEEAFLFDDGEQQERIWTLTPQGNNSFSATAGDVVGIGDAQFAGNSMFLNYVLRVPYNDDTIDLTIDDRMYLVNENTLINESKMYKFGFQVGSILLVIQKPIGHQ